jgi:hypothetical protein
MHLPSVPRSSNSPNKMEAHRRPGVIDFEREDGRTRFV